MKATLTCLAALLLIVAGASLARANPYFPPPHTPAPDACGPGFYVTNYCGLTYGPNYWLRPPFPPFNGILPSPRPCDGQGQPQGFPTHPYARGPRDYFMID